ncbi:hypothetical protein NX059_007964 [Plenodomus lindquistii]|nr:hypothetical protein NX059_007964 [Plenodomus lindquistii]
MKKKRSGLPLKSGYEVEAWTNAAPIDKDPPSYPEDGIISDFKLLLDSSDRHLELKKELLRRVGKLRKRGAIKQTSDVICHALTELFHHIKKFLEKLSWTDRSKVDLTFCVPVCWNCEAIAIMESCVKKAMKDSRLGSDGELTPELFTVQEAEAAALGILKSRSRTLRAGTTVLIIDAGGGTTDLGAYRLTASSPPRLDSEVSKTSGEPVGSRDLNEALREFARSQLQDSVNDFEYDSIVSLDWIINRYIIKDFEMDTKRLFNLQDKDKIFPFCLHGLRESSTNPRVMRHRFVLDYDDMMNIFRPPLQQIASLMKRQIDEAHDTLQAIDEVFLAGGFGDSPALQEYLKNALNDINEEHRTNIKINYAPPGASATAVALGTLARGLDRTNGPKRLPQMSIGHDVSICTADDKHYPEDVLQQRSTWSKLAQARYVMKTIQWRIKKGQGELESQHHDEFAHVFCLDPYQKTWNTTLYIYGSDSCTEDFYTKSHPKNRGKVFDIRVLSFDLQRLREKIALSERKEQEDGHPKYEVTLQVGLTVIDRNFTCQATWYDAVENTTHHIVGTREPISLLSTFSPGTV